MRLVKPNQPSRPVDNGSGWLVPKLAVPGWLRDRLDYDGKYVLMECGHKDNTVGRWQLIRAVFPDSEVFCQRCNRFRTVVAHMHIRQYLGVSDSPTPPEPLF